MAPAKLEVRSVRYSFPVGLFHSRLHAGLSRRTDSLGDDITGIFTCVDSYFGEFDGRILEVGSVLLPLPVVNFYSIITAVH